MLRDPPGTQSSVVVVVVVALSLSITSTRRTDKETNKSCYHCWLTYCCYQGKYQEAEDLFSRAFAIYDKLVHKEHEVVASAYANKGNLRKEQARPLSLPFPPPTLYDGGDIQFSSSLAIKESFFIEEMK